MNKMSIHLSVEEEAKKAFKLKQAPEVVNGPAPAMGQGHGLFESCPIPAVRAARY